MTILFVTNKADAVFPVSSRLDITIELQDVSRVLKSCHDFNELLLYVDCRYLDQNRLQSIVRKLSKACPAGIWGLYDPDGLVQDPASLFHAGAGDYIGPSLRETPSDTKRFKRVLDWARQRGTVQAAAELSSGCSDQCRVDEAEFPGWKAVQVGETRNFYFLYIAAEHADSLREKYGERRWTDINTRLHNYLTKMLEPCDALHWMKNEVSSLYLIPAEGRRCERAIEELLRFLLSLPLLSADILDFDTVFPLVFALHRGSIPFRKPGETGTMISDDVNFIFHLGTKKAEAGRLSIAASAAPAIRRELAFLFVNNGSFEGQSIKKSRRFL